MKRVNILLFNILILILVFVTNSCKDKDDNSPDEINKFIWIGLHNYYLWTDNVANLSLSKFPSEASLNSFVNQYADHEAFFYSLLYQRNVIDKWSWIVDDYNELDNMLQGISKTMGFDFRLMRITGSNEIFGYVRYVWKNSPAYYAGVKRGDIFIKVNNQQLTMDNYETLLFETESYYLSFADIINKQVIPNGKSSSVMAALVLQENPILLDTIYTINSSKIGYLVYNSFLPDFDIELNNTFTYFKSNAIDYLIIDLRYNGGGSIQSAINLASMIYSTDKTKLFCKTKYNNNLEEFLTDEYGADFFNNYFADSIKLYNEDNVITDAAPISSLYLPKIHIITSDNTASASELIINGLRGYSNITVKTIGDTTHGKYVGSITVKDYIDNEGNVNPRHKWAMQPIVLKIANAIDVSDYIQGFIPEVALEEDITNLLPLGDLNEPFLKATVNNIFGTPVLPSSLQKSKSIQFQTVFDSKQLKPYKTDMYLNLELPKLK